MGNSTSSGESTAVGGKAIEEPLLFHPTCSENIVLEAGGKRAVRKESFCKGICFSRRPVRINEKVCLRIVSLSTNWSGFLRIGFTSHNPREMDRTQLPRYACPDLVNLPGYWAKALPEQFSAVNNVISYYVAADGTVHLLLNQENFGVFLEGVDTRSTLWAMVDIYGNCTGVEIIEGSAAARAPMLPSAIEIPASTPLKFYKRISPQTLFFHSFCGQNVSINVDRTIATRQPAQYSNGYVFISQPLRPGERVVVQVLTVEPIYAGGLTVGMTSCDPGLLDKRDLPDDADALLDRKEYWVVHKDVHVNAVCGDELAFSLGAEGELHFSKNGLHSSVILHVDMTIPLWLFLDMYGQIGKLRLHGAAPTTVAGLPAAASPGLMAPVLLPKPLPQPLIPFGAADVESSSSNTHSSRPLLPLQPVEDGLRVELPPPGLHHHHSDEIMRPRQLLLPYGHTAATSAAAVSATLLPTPLHTPPPPAAIATLLPAAATVDAPAASESTMALPPVPPRIPRSGGGSVTRLPSPTPPSTMVPAAAVPSWSAADTLAAGKPANSGASPLPPATSLDAKAPGEGQTSECIVCFEKACDTVIYTCGHVCMCFACAASLRQQATPLCPICRQVIQDVIRMFRS